MGVADILWTAFFSASPAYLFYRSLWKKKGHCHGCSGGLLQALSAGDGSHLSVLNEW